MESIKKIMNFVFLPLRVILKPEPVRKLGLTPIVDERHKIVLSHVNGKLLDIGCGENLLVKQYGDGIGVDVFPWEELMFWFILLIYHFQKKNLIQLHSWHQ